MTGVCACQNRSEPIEAPAIDSEAASAASDVKPTLDGEPITFTRHVARIVYENCSGCHHPGAAAPFSLLTYDDVRRRAGQIVDVTQKRFMPPWLPTQGHDDFADARRLTPEQLQTLKQWSDTESPRGDDSDLPPAPVFADGWQTGPPDLVLESPTYTLAADGRDVFRNFVVPIQSDAPRWVQSIELRPENPRVTHHARLGVDGSHESIRRDAEDPESGYAGMAWGQDPEGQLVTWAPGMVAVPGTPDVAWQLHPKTCLVLHTHMQPSGKPEAVKFRIGIHFAKEPPKEHPAMLRVGGRNIDIPAGDADYVVADEYTLPIDVDLRMIFPHAHSLCHEVHVAAELPDRSRKDLISIEHFDENWHETYRYRSPVRLPRGTRLTTTFAYDNTEGNLRNRNRPPKRVGYGSNAEDEMADVYLQVTPVHADQREVLMEHYKRYEMQSQIVGFRKTLELNPSDPWSQEGMAACYVGLGKPADAIPILEKRLKQGPAAVFPMVSLGMALLARGDVARAETQLREAIAMDGEYPLAWFGLGKALVAQKKPEPAEQAYRRALELAPGLADARLNLADLLIQRDQLEEAARTFSTAIGDSPDMANVYLKLAEISTRQRHYDEALEHFETAQRLAPYTHPPKVLLAVYCFQNGDLEKAQAMLRAARLESPDHPVPAFYLGQLARRAGQVEAARSFLAEANSLPLPKNWPESHQQRFLVLLHSERLQLAEQLQDVAFARDAFAQWMKCDPENEKLRKMFERFKASAGL